MMKQAIKTTLFLLCLATLLGGCTTSGNYSREGFSGTPYTESAEHYLQLAAVTFTPEKERYELLAANRLLEDGHINRAENVLITISPVALPEELMNEYKLLNGKLALMQKHPFQAIKMLRGVINTNTLSKTQQIEYFQLAATAYQNTGNYFESAKHSIALEALLTNPSERINTQRSIWSNLQRLSPTELRNLENQSLAMSVHGWVSLVNITNFHANDPKQLIIELEQWQKHYSGHSANEMLPNSLSSAVKIVPDSPNKIALLLPLHGKYGNAGSAIRDGFFSAYYNESSPFNRPSIEIYDTSETEGIKVVYDKAVSDGAELIIGPLQKTHLEQLAKEHSLPIPTLALNYLPDDADTSNGLIQFGLSPQNEARSAAEKSWSAGHRQAIIIAPAGEWGESVESAFRERWLGLGGEIVGRFAFNNNNQLPSGIKNLMNVDQSKLRYQQIAKLFKDKLHFTPRRRQDADMIFLVAPPKSARQIKPLLKFYFAGEIPVYATSLVYKGVPNQQADRDMNDIFFCDIPWVLTNKGDIAKWRSDLSQLQPNNFPRHPRLYALGIDAYKLTSTLNLLSTIPVLGVNGTTGKLYLNKQHKIERELLWAKIKQGSPVLM